MSWLNAEAESNIYFISVTCAVFQLPNVLVERRSVSNIDLISVTFAVFQLPMSWLNAEADQTYNHISHLRCVPTPNVLVERRSGQKHISIVVTCSVFQLPMSWLNAEAEENIAFIDVADAVFHFEMLPMN